MVTNLARPLADGTQMLNSWGVVLSLPLLVGASAGKQTESNGKSPRVTANEPFSLRDKSLSKKKKNVVQVQVQVCQPLIVLSQVSFAVSQNKLAKRN